MTLAVAAAMECVVACENALGEGVVWCPRQQRLWWVDVLAGHVHEWRLSDGLHRVHETVFRRIGSLALRQKGGLVLATEQGLFAWDPERATSTLLVNPEPDRLTHRLNDGRCDRAGRFWVGSMHDTQFVPEGALFRVGANLDVSRLEEGIVIPNSIAFSPDDRTFYFADTRKYVIWAYDFSLSEGVLDNRRVFASYGQGPGRPDGSCVDREGCLWNAVYAGGKIVRYTPNGRVDRIVELPVSYPTCCCFGGSDLDILFVTSARFPLSAQEQAAQPLSGSVLALRPGVQGLPEPAFSG